MSALRVRTDIAASSSNVRFAPKTDIAERYRHVGFVPEADLTDYLVGPLSRGGFSFLTFQKNGGATRICLVFVTIL